ncbi:MAG TPA: protein-disulfide isomerase [Rheinheimera sp.]|uniref:thiol:disulfide interchange protein DsbA/DsbL n=1 Tax=Rheinheimera sp. TaxID=1869214 RepID=UPI000ECD6BA0|nr:thiol:disulfide interchange protein DsbA/DsbL [Rheinheimera sp.]HCU65949.1 protein-disulfide isomerase [Rheinheimera sp.]
MKKLMMWFAAALLLVPAVQAAGKYEEGEHYQVISEQKTAKPEVKEFFSFYCPHCNAFEPVVQSLEKSLPEGVALKKFHVDFMGGAKQETQAALSRAMVLGKVKGKGNEVNRALFEHIHTKRKAFASEQDIREVVLSAGIDAADYDKNINNFVVKSQVSLMQKEQNTLSKSRVLTSVPTFIVNGRYKIDISKLDQSNLEQDLKALVNHLLQLP